MDSAPSDAAAFLTRNAVDALPQGGLERKLVEAEREGRQLRAKLGLDPTAADIHLGHTVVLQKLREFQDLGHKVVLIVGDFTARVGDPSGRSSTRPVLSGEEIDRNARTYQEQAFSVLRDDPELYELRFNSEWLDMPMEELFRLARTATVAQMLERDDFAKRFASRAPISVLELLYPLMQGYDSVAIRSDVELGGTDQTFNLLLARDVQRAYGVPEQTILTVPILPGTDGEEKMSKSLGNYVGIAEPPQEIFGKLMSISDELMWRYIELLSFEPLATVRKWKEEVRSGANPRDVKVRFAAEIVARFHGEAAARKAQEGFEQRFREGVLPEDMRELAVKAPEGGMLIAHLLKQAGLTPSTSEAQRMIEQGGVKLDGERVSDKNLKLQAGRIVVAQVGKRKFARIRIE